MNDHPPAQGDDVALARLRGADPAATAEPDPSALREAVRRRADLPAAGAGGSGPDGGAGGDELARARRRRLTSWPARAAAAAAVALVVGGGGGYALGAAGPSQQDEGGAAAVISLNSAQDGAGSPGMQGLPGDSSAATEESGPEPLTGVIGGDNHAFSEQGRVAELSMPGWGGRTVFTAEGLPTDGGALAAWGFDPGAAFTAEGAATAARALGVEGEVSEADGMLSVGPRDGTGASIQLYPDGMVSLSFYDPERDPWACLAVRTSEEPTADELQDCSTRDLGPAPQGEEAGAVLREVLGDLGLDPEGYELVTEGVEGAVESEWSSVVAHQVVDGQRTGVTWSATFTGGGLQTLHGSLAPLVPLGEYAVVSPTEAVERLEDPRFGAGWGGMTPFWGAYGLEGDAATVMPRGGVGSGAGPAEPSLPAGAEPGASVQWPVRQVTVVDARLGLALHTQADGTAMLVPTYELTGSDGGTWSVIAVTEDHLDLSPAG
ncbi:hypothetical protein J4G33_14465 [Actinotalea sp. BY-33]|uniref:Uncharacterized protein n=1 Tax=Actinotalea soli TaxID=2819234 RepID=A0A939LS09_9CELL|nr:hypothetical protein [Actinotalea soli]MBO1753013.1 hypothetical protein [Actinotalea soli]